MTNSEKNYEHDTGAKSIKQKRVYATSSVDSESRNKCLPMVFLKSTSSHMWMDDLKRMLLSFILRLQPFFRLLFETLSPSFTIHFSLLCKNIQLTGNVLTPLIHLHKSCSQQWIRRKVLESSLTKVCLQLKAWGTHSLLRYCLPRPESYCEVFSPILAFWSRGRTKPTRSSLKPLFFLDFCVDSEGDFCRL